MMGNAVSLATWPSLETQFAKAGYIDVMEFVEILTTLPTSKELEHVETASRQILEEKKELIRDIRETADTLSRAHRDSTLAVSVGIGTSVASGFLTFGGIILAPFTAGLSLGLTAAGTTIGVAGGATAAGTNLTYKGIVQFQIQKLRERMDKRASKIQELDDLLLTTGWKASAFQPQLEELGNLSENDFASLLESLRAMAKLAIDKDWKTIKKIADDSLSTPGQDFLLSNVSEFLTSSRSSRKEAKSLEKKLSLLLEKTAVVYDSIRGMKVLLQKLDLGAMKTRHELGMADAFSVMDSRDLHGGELPGPLNYGSSLSSLLEGVGQLMNICGGTNNESEAAVKLRELAVEIEQAHSHLL